MCDPVAEVEPNPAKDAQMRQRIARLGVLAILLAVLPNAKYGGEAGSAPSNGVCFYAAAPELTKAPSTGYGFIQLLPVGGPQAGQKDLIFGYGSWNDAPTGDGVVNWDKGHYWDWKICYPVTPAKYNAIATFIREQIRTPDRYDLMSGNCIQWIQEVADIANVKLPSARPTAHTNLALKDPETFARSLKAIGDGGTYAGGIVHENSQVVMLQKSDGPPPLIPDQCSYAGTEAAAFRDPDGLAAELNRQAHDLRLGPEFVGVGHSLVVQLQNVSVEDAIVAVDFGDGSFLEQQTSNPHVYPTPGAFTVTVVVVGPRAVDRFSFLARVSVAGGSASKSIAVPTDPPPVPFPAVAVAYCPESLDGPGACGHSGIDNPGEYSYVNTHYYHALADEGALPDERYFNETGFRVDNDTIWDYFNERGGLDVFGYPISRTFTFQGLTVQFFQRRVVEVDAHGQPRFLNVLGPGFLGSYSYFNGATLPRVDPTVVATAPNPLDALGILAFVGAHAPDRFQGMPVNFGQGFLKTVAPAIGLSLHRDANWWRGLDLNLWGLPTSAPVVDPNNHSFVYLRFQQGIMQYDASCHCTQSVLLGDFLKSVMTGQGLPDDLRREAQGSP
jgi:hypothetical protein